MEVEPAVWNSRGDISKNVSDHTLLQTMHLGGIALAGSRPGTGLDRYDDWQHESQMITKIAANLQQITDPYVEAAQKIVPQGKDKRTCLSRFSREGKYSYVNHSIQNDSNIFTRFTVKYSRGKLYNPVSRLKVGIYHDKEPDESRIPDQYVCIDVSDGDAGSIQFGGIEKSSLGIDYMQDNRIEFNANGISYDSWRLGLSRIERKYDSKSDSFVSIRLNYPINLSRGATVDPKVKPLPPMAPNEVISTAKKALALIPVEDEIPLY